MMRVLQIVQRIKTKARTVLAGLKRRIKGVFYLPNVTVDFPRPWKPINILPLADSHNCKVLVVSHMFPQPVHPGSGSFVLEQVHALQEQGVDVRVVVGLPYFIRSRNVLHMWRTNRLYKLYERQQRWWDFNGIPVYYAYYKIVAGFWSHGWFYRRALMRQVDTIVRDFPFDLVHAHSSYLDGTVAHAISRKYNLPFVITEHTNPFSTLTSNPIVRYFTLRALRHAEKIIAVSEAQKRQVDYYLPSDVSKYIETVPNLIDTRTFYYDGKWNPDMNAPRLLFVGYFVPYKNIPLLLQSVVRVQKVVPATRLTLIGGGELEALIKAKISDLGLEESVEVLPYMSRFEVARFMREKSDLLILCSYTETFGVVLIESLASGRPVVATRCGGPEDIVTESFLGELCAVDDPDALASAILDVTHNLSEYDPNRISEYAHQHYSSSTIAKAIIQVYNSLMRKVTPESQVTT